MRGWAQQRTVAGELKTTHFTVGFWRNRFIQKGGLEALGDEPRPGAPRKIGDEKDRLVRQKRLWNPSLREPRTRENFGQTAFCE